MEILLDETGARSENLQQNLCVNLHSKRLLLHQQNLQKNYWMCIDCGSQKLWSRK